MQTQNRKTVINQKGEGRFPRARGRGIEEKIFNCTFSYLWGKVSLKMKGLKRFYGEFSYYLMGVLLLFKGSFLTMENFSDGL